jgi:predicted DNA-binding transcriptional regulator AlpA
MSSPTLILPSDLPKFGITTSDSQLRRLEKAGKFPRRVFPTERSHAYVEDEIRQHIVDRMKARDDLTEREGLRVAGRKAQAQRAA